MVFEHDSVRPPILTDPEFRYRNSKWTGGLWCPYINFWSPSHFVFLFSPTTTTTATLDSPSPMAAKVYILYVLHFLFLSRVVDIPDTTQLDDPILNWLVVVYVPVCFSWIWRFVVVSAGCCGMYRIEWDFFVQYFAA